MLKKLIGKKTLAIAVSAIYVQVNVAWAGIPYNPLPTQTVSLARRLVQKILPSPSLSDQAFVFHQGPLHFPQPWEEDRYRVPPELKSDVPRRPPVEAKKSAESSKSPIAVEKVRKQPMATITPNQRKELQSYERTTRETDEAIAGTLSDIAGKNLKGIGQQINFADSKDTYLDLLARADREGFSTSVKSDLNKLNQSLSGTGLLLTLVQTKPGGSHTSRTFHLDVKQIVTKDDLKDPSSVVSKLLTAEDKSALVKTTSLNTGSEIPIENYVTLTRPVEGAIGSAGLNNFELDSGLASGSIQVDLTQIIHRTDALPAMSFGEVYKSAVAHEAGRENLREINPPRMKDLLSDSLNPHISQDARRAAVKKIGLIQEFFALSTEITTTYHKEDSKTDHRTKLSILRAIGETADHGGIVPPQKKGAAHLVVAAFINHYKQETNQKNATFNDVLIHLRKRRGNPSMFDGFIQAAVHEGILKTIGLEGLGKKDAADEVLRPQNIEDASRGIAKGRPLTVRKVNDHTGPVLLDSDPSKNAQRVKVLFPGIDAFSVDLGKATIQTFGNDFGRDIRLVSQTKAGEPVSVYRQTVGGRRMIQLETTAKGAVDLGISVPTIAKLNKSIQATGNCATTFVIGMVAGKSVVIVARDENRKVRFIPGDKTAEERAPDIVVPPSQFDDHVKRGGPSTKPVVHKSDFLKRTDVLVTDKNFRDVLKEIGYRGRWSDVRTYTFNPGQTKLVKERGRLQIEGGPLRWTTKNGIKYTAINEEKNKGQIRIDLEVSLNADPKGVDVIEVNPANESVPTARTLYHPGDKESRVNGELVRFKAERTAITREVFVKRGGGHNGQQPPHGQVKNLQGSVGRYVVREGKFDSTFKMLGSKVQLIRMETNTADENDQFQILASYDAASGRVMGNTAVTGVGKEGGIEREFEVLGGPIFDPDSGRAILNINSFHAKGDERSFSVRNGAIGLSGSLPPSRRGHFDKDLTIIALGNGKFKKVARTDSAVMAGTLSLSGASRQVASFNRENIRYRNKNGVLMGETLDALRDAPPDGSRHQSPPRTLVLTKDKKGQIELLKIGVHSSLPQVASAVDSAISLKRKNGRITEVQTTYKMESGAIATGFLSKTQNLMTLETKTTKPGEVFDIGSSSIYVPKGHTAEKRNAVVVNLNSGEFEPRLLTLAEKAKNTRYLKYSHLGGVNIEYRIVENDHQGNTVVSKINVGLSVGKDGKITPNFIGASGTDFTFADEKTTISTAGLAFGGGRVFFPLIKDLDLTGKDLTLGENEEVKNISGKAGYLNFDLLGRKSVSVEIKIKGDISYKKKKPVDVGPTHKTNPDFVTPGARSFNVRFYVSGEQTRVVTRGPNASVAALVTEQRDDNGKAVLSARLNPQAKGNAEMFVDRVIKSKDGLTGVEIDLSEEGSGWTVSRMEEGKEDPKFVRAGIYTLISKKAGEAKVEIDGVIHSFKTERAGLRFTVNTNRTAGRGKISADGTADLIIRQDDNDIVLVTDKAVKGKVTGDLVVGKAVNGHETPDPQISFPLELKTGRPSSLNRSGTARYGVTVFLNGQKRGDFVFEIGKEGGDIRFDGWGVRSGSSKSSNNAWLKIPARESDFDFNTTHLKLTGLVDGVIGQVKDGKVVDDAVRPAGFRLTAIEGAPIQIPFKFRGSERIFVNKGPVTVTNGKKQNAFIDTGGMKPVGRNARIRIPKSEAVRTGAFVLGYGMEGDVTGDAVTVAFDSSGKRDFKAERTFSWTIRFNQKIDDGQATLPIRGSVHGRYQLTGGEAGDVLSYDGQKFGKSAIRDLKIQGSNDIGVMDVVPRPLRQEGYKASITQRDVVLSIKDGRRDLRSEQPLLVTVIPDQAHTGKERIASYKTDEGRLRYYLTVDLDKSKRFKLINGDAFAFAKGAKLELVNGRGLHKVLGTGVLYYNEEAVKSDGISSKVFRRGFAAFKDAEGYIARLSRVGLKTVTFEKDDARVDLIPGGGSDHYLTGKRGATVTLQRGGDRGPDLIMTHGDLRWVVDDAALTDAQRKTLSVDSNDGITKISRNFDPFLGETEESWSKGAGFNGVHYSYKSDNKDAVNHEIYYNTANFEKYDKSGTAYVLGDNGKFRAFTLNRQGVWTSKRKDPLRAGGRTYFFSAINNSRTYRIEWLEIGWNDEAYERENGRVLYLLTPSGILRKTDVYLDLEISLIPISGREGGGLIHRIAVVDRYSTKAKTHHFSPDMFLQMDREQDVRGVTIWNMESGSVRNDIRYVSPESETRKTTSVSRVPMVGEIAHWFRGDGPSISGRVVSYAPDGRRTTAIFTGKMEESGWGQTLRGIIDTNQYYTAKSIMERGLIDQLHSPKTLIFRDGFVDPRLNRSGGGGHGHGEKRDFREGDRRYDINIYSVEYEYDTDASGKNRYKTGLYLEVSGRIQVQGNQIDLRRNSNLMWSGDGRLLPQSNIRFLELMGTGGEIVQLSRGDVMKFDGYGTSELSSVRGRKDVNRTAIKMYNAAAGGWTINPAQTAWDTSWYGSTLNFISDHPLEFGISAAVFVTGIGLSVFTGGTSAGIGLTYFFGISGTTGLPMTVLLSLGAGANAGFIVHGLINEEHTGKHGFFTAARFWVLDVGLALIPVGTATFRAARFWNKLGRFSASTSFFGKVHDINVLYEAAVAAGIEGVGFGVGVTEEGMENVTRFLNAASRTGAISKIETSYIIGENAAQLGEFTKAARRLIKKTGGGLAVVDDATKVYAGFGFESSAKGFGESVDVFLRNGASADNFAFIAGKLDGMAFKQALKALSGSADGAEKAAGNVFSRSFNEFTAGVAQVGRKGVPPIPVSAGVVGTKTLPSYSFKSFVVDLVKKVRSEGVRSLVPTIRNAYESGKISLPEGLSALARALWQNGEARQFFKLGRELVEGNETLTSFFRFLGRDGARRLGGALARGGETAIGLLDEVSSSIRGLKVLGAALKDGVASKKIFVILATKPESREMGRVLAGFFTNGGKSTVRFFRKASKSTVEALGKRAIRLVGDVQTGQKWMKGFAGAVRAGKGLGDDFVEGLNSLRGEQAFYFLNNLFSEESFKGVIHLAGKFRSDSKSGFVDLMKFFGQSDSITETKNLGIALSEGGDAAVSWIVEGASAGKQVALGFDFSSRSFKAVLDLLATKDRKLVSGFFRGLAAGGSKAGTRLTLLGRSANNLIKGINDAITRGGGSGDIEVVAEAVGRGIATMNDGVFLEFGYFLQKGGVEARQSLVKLITISKDSVEHTVGFLTQAGLSGREARMFFATAKILSGRGSDLALLAGSLTNNGQKSLGIILGGLGGVSFDKAAGVLADLFSEGKLAAVSILREASPEAAEHWGRGLANLAHTGADAKSFFASAFQNVNHSIHGIAGTAKAGDILSQFGKAVSSLFEGHGAKIAAEFASGDLSFSSKLGRALGRLFSMPPGKSSRSILIKAAEILGTRGSRAVRATMDGLDEASGASFQTIRNGLKTSAEGLEALDEFMESSAGRVVSSFFGRLTPSAQRVIIAIFRSSLGRAFVRFFSKLDVAGAGRLAGFLDDVGKSRLFSFFSGLKDSSKLAAALNRSPAVALKLKAALRSGDFTEEVSKVFGELIGSLSDGKAVVAAIDSLSTNRSIRSLAETLKSLDENGLRMLTRVFEGVDTKGAQSLGNLFGVTKRESLVTFFDGLESKGAVTISQVLNGLDKTGRSSIRMTFSKLTVDGAGVLADVANAADGARGLFGMFNHLTVKGARGLADLLNSAVGAAQKSFVAVFSVLSETGGRAFAGILNKGTDAVANLKTVLASLGKKTAKVFGRTLNGFNNVGIENIAAAFTSFTEKSAKAFAAFVGKIGDPARLSGFINGLRRNGGKILSGLMTDLAVGALKMRIISSLFRNLKPEGSESFGRYLGRISNRSSVSAALRFVRNLSEQHIPAFANFLNNASAQAVDALAALTVKNPENLLHVLAETGHEGGKALSRLLDTTATGGMELFQQMLADQEFSEVLADSLGTMGDDGAALLGKLLNAAKSEEGQAAVKKLFKLHGESKAGEELGRLFAVLAENDVKISKIGPLLKNSVENGGAGEVAGILIRHLILESGVIGATDAERVAGLVTNVLGKNSNEAYLRGLFRGLFGDGRIVSDGSRVAGLKATLEALLSSESALSPTQKNAIRAAARALYPDIDELTPLLTLRGRIKGSIIDSVVYRWQKIAMLVSQPETYFRMMYMNAVSWAVFGFTGVGALLPFGYESDGGFYWGWKDPTNPYEKAEFSWDAFGKIVGIVFTTKGLTGKYLQWRLNSAAQLYLTGRRYGILLNVGAYQPVGAGRISNFFAGISERGAIGSFAHHVVRRVWNFSVRPWNWIAKKTGKDSLVLKVREAWYWNFSHWVHGLTDNASSGVFRVFGRRAAQSSVAMSIGHLSGTAIAGAEGVMLIHTFSSIGSYAGYKIGYWFATQTTWGREEAAQAGRLGGRGAEKIAAQWAEVAGMMAMFATPMARFRPQFARKFLEPGVKGEKVSPEAMSLASDILAGKREVQVGTRFIRLSAADVTQLQNTAAHVLVKGIGQRNGGKVLHRAFDVLDMKEGEAKDVKVRELQNDHPDLYALDFNDASTGELVFQELMQMTGMSVSELAEFVLRSRMPGIVDKVNSLSSNQVKRVLKQRAIRKVHPDFRRRASRDINNRYDKMNDQDARAELTNVLFDQDLASGKAGAFKGGRVSAYGVPFSGAFAAEVLRRDQSAVVERLSLTRIGRLRRSARLKGQRIRLWFLEKIPGPNRSDSIEKVAAASWGSYVDARGNIVSGQSVTPKGADFISPTLQRVAERIAGERRSTRRFSKLNKRVDGWKKVLDKNVFSKATRRDVVKRARILNERGYLPNDITLAKLGVTDLHGFETMSVGHYLRLAEEYAGSSRAEKIEMANEIGWVLEIFKIESTRWRAKTGDSTTWQPGQLYSTIESARFNIDMSAGGGKTAVMAFRSLIEAAKADGGDSAVMLMAENPESVTNLLGKDKRFDIEAIGKELGIDVVDLRLELEKVRGGKKSIRDVNRLLTDLSESSYEGGPRRRRIVVIDFDTLGGALSEFKNEGFLEAYTNTQVRIFDEVHRVTTDPVMYVIGGEFSGNKARSRAGFKAVKALEDATVAQRGERGVGIFFEGGEEYLGIRVTNGKEKVRVFRKYSEFKKASDEGEAAVYLDPTKTGQGAGANEKAHQSINKILGFESAKMGVNAGELQSFLKGRLAESNSIDVEMALVPVKMADGTVVEQYRPIQRGLGLKESQVVEDFAHLMGLNARRRELFRDQSFDLHIRDSGDIQVLVTIRGVSRNTFFERTGEALRTNGAVKIRGFTATTPGFEGFIRAATGAEILPTLSNTIGETVLGLQALEIFSGSDYRRKVIERGLNIAEHGQSMYQAKTGDKIGISDKRLIFATEDSTLMNEFIGELGGLAERLVSKDWVYDIKDRKAVRVGEANVTVKRVGDRGVIETGDRSRFKPIRRVIDNTTSPEQIQAIVTSFAEDGAIVISNQRGLTGKDFQQTGTILLADPQVTSAEAIQNLERLGRVTTVTDPAVVGGRWGVNRQVFLSADYLETQLTNAYKNRSIYDNLFKDIAQSKKKLNPVGSKEALATKNSLDNFFSKVDEVRGTKSSDAEAVRHVVERLAKSSTGKKNLFRLNTELNLLERNTTTAKTIANEIFFHFDLERPLNQAKFEARFNEKDQRILDEFEQEFRNARQRSNEQITDGNGIVDATTQLDTISNQSRLRSLFLISKFLTEKGRRLSRPVRRVFEKHLRLLRESKGEKLKDVVKKGEAVPVTDEWSFGRVGQNETDGLAYFRNTRRLVHERLKNHMAPAVDGKRKTPRTLVQMTKALQEQGGTQDQIDAFRSRIYDNPEFTQIRRGKTTLSVQSQAYADMVLAIVSLGDDEKKALKLILDKTALTTPAAVENAFKKWEEGRDSGGIQLAMVVTAVLAEEENGLLDLSDPTDGLIPSLVRFGTILETIPDAVATGELERTDLLGFLNADVPDADLFDKDENGNALPISARATLHQAVVQAPMTAFLNWVTEADRAPSVVSQSREFSYLRKKAGQLNAVHNAAINVIDRAILPSAITRGFLSFVNDASRSVKNFTKGKWKSFKAASLTGKLVKGTLGAGLAVAIGVGIWFGWSALALAGLGLPIGIGAGVIGSLVGISKWRSSTAVLGRATKAINNELKTKIKDSDRSSVRRMLAILGATPDQLSNSDKALSLFTELGDTVKNAWSRLTMKDLAEIVGVGVAEGGSWGGFGRWTPGKREFRSAFRLWLGENTRPKMEFPSAIKNGLTWMTKALQFSPILMAALGVSFGTIFIVSLAGVGLGKVLGMETMFDKISSMFGKNSELSEADLKPSFWFNPLFSWIGSLIGIKGDKGAFDILLKFARWKRDDLKKEEEDVKTDGEFDQKKLLAKLYGDSDSDEDPTITAERFESTFSEDQLSAAYVLYGFTPEERARIQSRIGSLTKGQRDNGHLRKISLDDLADPHFNFKRKVAQLDYDAVSSALMSARGKLKEGESLREDDFIRIADENGLQNSGMLTAADKAKAVDRLIIEANGKPVTVHNVQTVVAQFPESYIGHVAVRTFLIESLGADPAVVKANLETIRSKVNEVLTGTGANNMEWGLPMLLSVHELSIPGFFDSTTVPAFMGRLGAGLMRSWVETPVNERESADRTVYRLRAFHRQFANYVANQNATDREIIRDGIRGALSQDSRLEIPWNFTGDDAATIQTRMERLHASIILADLEDVLKTEGHDVDVTALHQTLTRSLGYESIGELLDQDGFDVEGLNLQAYLRFYRPGRPMMDVLKSRFNVGQPTTWGAEVTSAFKPRSPPQSSLPLNRPRPALEPSHSSIGQAQTLIEPASSPETPSGTAAAESELDHTPFTTIESGQTFNRQADGSETVSTRNPVRGPESEFEKVRLMFSEFYQEGVLEEVADESDAQFTVVFSGSPMPAHPETIVGFRVHEFRSPDGTVDATDVWKDQSQASPARREEFEVRSYRINPDLAATDRGRQLVREVFGTGSLSSGDFDRAVDSRNGPIGARAKTNDQRRLLSPAVARLVEAALPFVIGLVIVGGLILAAEWYRALAPVLQNPGAPLKTTLELAPQAGASFKAVAVLGFILPTGFFRRPSLPAETQGPEPARRSGFVSADSDGRGFTYQSDVRLRPLHTRVRNGVALPVYDVEGGEQLYAAFETTVPEAGQTVIEDFVPLRRVHILGSAKRPTKTEIDLAVELSKIRPYLRKKDGTPTLTRTGLRKMNALLDDAAVGVAARQIRLASLEGTGAASFKNPDTPTLGDFMVHSAASRDVKARVLALVVANAETLSTGKGLVVTANVWNEINHRFSDRRIVPLHTQQSVEASGTDQIAEIAMARAFGIDSPFLISAEGRLNAFDGERALLTIHDEKKDAALPSLVVAPYQSLQTPTLIRQIYEFLTGLFGGHKARLSDPAVLARRFYGPGDLEMAKEALTLAYALHASRVSPNEMMKIWNVVGAVAVGAVRPEEISSVLASRNGYGAAVTGSRVNLASLIQSLAEEMKRSSAGALNFALRGEMRTVALFHRHVVQYNAVAGIPKKAEADRIANWVLKESNRLRLNLMTPREAAALDKQLTRRIDGADKRAELAKLGVFLGINDLDQKVVRRIGRRHGVVAVTDSLRRAFAGNDALSEGADRIGGLTVLLDLYRDAILNYPNPWLSDEMKREIQDARIVVMNERDLPVQITHRKAGILPAEDGLTIVIGVPEEAATDEAIFTAVERMAHELVHPQAHVALAGYELGSLGIPTVVEETFVQQVAVNTLRGIGLDYQADRLERESARQIVRQEEKRVVYIPYADLKGNLNSISDLGEVVLESEGKYEVGVLIAESDEVPTSVLNRIWRRGLKVIPRDGLSVLEGYEKVDILSAYTRLHFMTSRYALTSQAQNYDGLPLYLQKLISESAYVPLGTTGSLAGRVSAIFQSTLLTRQNA